MNTTQAPRITTGTRITVQGTDYQGTVTEVRNNGTLFRVALDQRSGDVFYGASELIADAPDADTTQKATHKAIMNMNTAWRITLKTGPNKWSTITIPATNHTDAIKTARRLLGNHPVTTII